MNGEVYLVCWDIHKGVSYAQSKRFYRFLHKLLGDAYYNSLVLRSLLEVDDLDTALEIYRAAAEIGDVRLYRAIKVSVKEAGSAYIPLL